MRTGLDPKPLSALVVPCDNRCHVHSVISDKKIEHLNDRLQFPDGPLTQTVLPFLGQLPSYRLTQGDEIDGNVLGETSKGRKLSA